MKITYTLTDEDFQKYISTNFEPNKFNIKKIFFVFVIVIFSLASLLFFIFNEYTLGIIMLSVVVLYVFLLIEYPKIMKKKYLKKLESSGKLNELKTIELNVDECRFISPSRTIIQDYSDFSSISVLNNDFIMITFKQEDSMVVPISAFSNKDEMITFVNRIKTNAKIL